LAAQQPLCGILNVDKPLEWTSHQVVAALRKWSGERRIGHAGTLDPLATGVLLLCLGKATRVSSYLMASTKVYHATLRLGLSTTTHDAEGKVVAHSPVDVSREQLEAALPPFVGQIEQVPPAYSAVKRQGKRLYEYARRGVEVQVPPRTVQVYDLSVLAWSPPEVVLRVSCGPGTYVRALARDLGQALGCGASLSALRRTASGQFRADWAVPLSEIERAYADAREAVSAVLRAHLAPLDAAFARLPALHLDAAGARRLVMGQGVLAERAPAGAPEVQHAPGLLPLDGHSRTYAEARAHEYARAYGPGDQFLALVTWNEDAQEWRPRKVFVQPDELLQQGDACTY
jgi:tRNA pseudouridine55 synthase